MGKRAEKPENNKQPSTPSSSEPSSGPSEASKAAASDSPEHKLPVIWSPKLDASGGIEEREKLRFRVFQRGVRHVVNERDPDVVCVGRKSVNQAGRAGALSPAGGNPAFYDEGHEMSPKPMTTVILATSRPCDVEGLSEIGDDVVDVLDSHAQPNHLRCDADLQLLFGGQLPVCRGRRMACE